MSLIRLTPACGAARLLTDGEPRLTMPSDDDGGPMCPFCRQTMRPHAKHQLRTGPDTFVPNPKFDPTLVKCVNKDCVAYAMPWRSSTAAMVAVEGQEVRELETGDDV